MLIVSDTTPIISLLKINKLELLKDFYDEIFIPQAVFAELTENRAFQDEAEVVKNCAFLKVDTVKNTQSVDILRKTTGLDAGESEAIVMYGEKNADLLLMDEKRGRKIAKQLDLNFLGTIGILLKAFDENKLSATEIDSCLKKLAENNIRVSEDLRNRILKYVNLVRNPQAKPVERW